MVANKLFTYLRCASEKVKGVLVWNLQILFSYEHIGRSSIQILAGLQICISVLLFSPFFLECLSLSKTLLKSFKMLFSTIPFFDE